MPDPPTAKSPSPDDLERQRLELEKLRLETTSLRNSTNRDALETAKLRDEIAEMNKAPRRAFFATCATILLTIATIGLSAAGFGLNRTITRAADHQRDFDNYSKLTDQFSKKGSARVGAIVGFQKLLDPGSSYASQVATVLANDLFEETDPVAVHGIVSDLQNVGMPAFALVREVHATALQRLYNDATQYTARKGLQDADTPKAALELRDAASADFSRQEGIEFYNITVESFFLELFKVQQPIVDHALLLGNHGAEDRAAWRARYVRDSATVFETGVLLHSLLQNGTSIPDQLDSSSVVLFDVDWTDRNLAGINLADSYITGDATGADLRNANLMRSRLAVAVQGSFHSTVHVTSFCGADLWHAQIGARIVPARTPSGLPSVGIQLEAFELYDDAIDFTASNWWTMDNLSPQVQASLERRFPRAEQERLIQQTRDEKVRMCRARRQ